MTAIGIDLGTSYARVAVYRVGKVENISNEQGKPMTPCYVAFTHKERLIGELAENKIAMNPKNTVFNVKRLIGRRLSDPSVKSDMEQWPFEVRQDNDKLMIGVEFKGQNECFTCEEMSAMILRKLKETAEMYLGEPVTEAVITVPANFNNSQRRATANAGKIAGLNVLQIINEPTAAALAYGFGKQANYKGNVLIFDLGGGAFDVSVVTIAEGIYTVKSTAGSTHLGGVDFDERVVNHFIAEFESEHNKDIRGNKRAIRRLYTACEGAKKTLSSNKQVRLELDSLSDGIDFYPSMTRTMFEKLNFELFAAIMRHVQECLRNAGMEKKQIDDIVLIGGSSRIPKVQQLLKDFFGDKKLDKSVNLDESVVHGAAIQAYILDGGKLNDGKDLHILETKSLSLGVETTGGVMTILIPRSRTIPIEQKQIFTTNSDNQSGVTMHLYEGEDEMVEKNTLLGNYDLSGIIPAGLGVSEIEVTFNIDNNGILIVTAMNKIDNNRRITITITDDISRLSDDDIIRMTTNVDNLSAEDKINRERITAKNDLESYINTMKDRIPNVDLQEIRKQIEEMNSSFDAKQTVTEEDSKQYREGLESIYNSITKSQRPGGKGM